MVLFPLAAGLVVMNPAVGYEVRSEANLPAPLVRTASYFDGQKAHIMGGFVEKTRRVVDLEPISGDVSSWTAQEDVFATTAGDGRFVYSFADRVRRYDPSTGSVTRGQSFAYPTAKSAVETSGPIYIFGGERYDIFSEDYESSREILRYDATSQSLARMSSLTPTPLYYRYAAFFDPRDSVCPGGCIFLLGVHDTLHPDPNQPIVHYRYHPATDTITPIHVAWPGRLQAAAVAWSGTYAYLFLEQENKDGSKSPAGVYRFDPVTLGLSKIAATLPDNRTAFAVASAADAAYITGGLGRNDVLRFDFATETFSLSHVLSTEIHGHGAVWVGSRIQLVGGAQQDFVSQATTFDPLTGAVSQGLTLPSGLVDSTVAGTRLGVAYLFGGRTRMGLSNQILRYDPSSSSITVAGTLPTPRSGLSSAYNGSFIYLFGGADAWGGLAEVLRFDPLDGSLKKMSEQLPRPTSGTGAAFDGRYIYVFGVIEEDHNPLIPRARALRYDPVADKMVRVGGYSFGATLTNIPVLYDGVNIWLLPFFEPVRFSPADEQFVRMTPSISLYPQGTRASGFVAQGRIYTVSDKIRALILTPGPVESLATVRGPDIGSINLSWSPSDPSTYSPNSHPITQYRVYRDSSPMGTTRQLIASVANPAFADTGLPLGAVRFYWVSAVNADGEGPLSFVVRGEAPGTPKPPQGLSGLSGPNRGEITIQWGVADDGGRRITSYRIYASDSGTGSNLIAEVGPSSITFTDSGLADGQESKYQVAAVNELGEGLRSPQIAARAPFAPSAPRDLTTSLGPSVGRVTLKWVAPATHPIAALDGFRVYRGSSEADLSLVAVVGRVTTFVDEGCGVGNICHYKVSAFNVAGEGLRSNTAQAVGLRVSVGPVW